MNSMPNYVSANRTTTTISTNTMPKAIMCSLAASLLMSQGRLCNVAEPEAEVVKEEAPWEGISSGAQVWGNKAEAPVRGPRLPVGVGVGPGGVLTQ